MLNKEQVESVEMVKGLLPGQAAAISGGPGTGKTHVTGHIVVALRNMGRRIAVTASSHEALGVLKSRARQHGWYGCVKTFRTIHSFLGLILQGDQLVDSGSDKTHGIDIVFIDEASTLDESIVTLAKSKGLVVVFVGDDHQLRSFDGKLAAFSVGGVELERTMRQDEGPITRLNDFIREAIDDEEVTRIPYHLLEPFIVKGGYEEFVELLDPDVPVLTFTNKAAAMWNRHIRAKLGRDREYCVGDKLVVTKPVLKEGRPVFHNNAKVIVRGASETTINGLSAWSLRVDDGEKSAYITVLSDCEDGTRLIDWEIEDCWDRIDKTALENFNVFGEPLSEEDQKWLFEHKRLTAVRDGFDSVLFGYAMTTHRAQGSEWPVVMVDFADFQRSRDLDTRKRLAYVALSRAKDNMFVLIQQ